jgi:hypothetical protein
MTTSSLKKSHNAKSTVPKKASVESNMKSRRKISPVRPTPSRHRLMKQRQRESHHGGARTHLLANLRASTEELTRAGTWQQYGVSSARTVKEKLGFSLS